MRRMGDKRRKAVLAVALGTLAAVAALALSHGGGRAHLLRGRAGGFEVGLQDDAVFLKRDYFNRDLAFVEARALGVSWLRVNVLWDRAAGVSAAQRSAPPTEGAVPWDWSSYDDVIDAAATHGIHVELTLTGPAPAWATASHRIGVNRPDPVRFAQFVQAAASHFRGRVSRYSIWNEPNSASWLFPQARAADLYRLLYEEGYASVRSVDPVAEVLIGETAGPAQSAAVTPALAFIRAVACRDGRYRPTKACGPLVANGYAHHPYDFHNPPAHAFPSADAVTLGSLGRLTSTLDRLAAVGALSDPRGRPLNVYLTEFGYFSSGRDALPPETRAAYLGAAYKLAASRYPRVRQLLQYLLVDPPPGYPGAAFDTGLVSREGATSPAYAALFEWAADAARRGRLAPP